VVAIVIREDGRAVLDDVIYLDEAQWDNEADRKNMRMSEYLAAGCDGARWGRSGLPDQPEALARSLYEQVLAHRPGEIPWGTERKIFAPYMSKGLLRRIDLYDACMDDWFRKYPDPNLKPPIWEGGIFSGGDEETEPKTSEIERTEQEKDGSVRVYVKLGRPQEKWTWQVADVLVRENGHYVVDDVIFLKENERDHDYRLSQILSVNCDGRRYRGLR
jgi:hypothetical protein